MLNFISEVLDNLGDGMAKITLSVKLSREIIWIAEGKVNGISYIITIIISKSIFSAI